MRVDERGRLVVPAELRSKIEADYLEARVEGGELVLSPIPDPLRILVGRVTRAKPLRDLDVAAEEEAERLLREEKEHAHSRS